MAQTVAAQGLQAATFFNLAPDDADPATARAIVIPFPYEATTSYRGGTKDGPAALMLASAQVELYDDELDWSPYTCGIATAPTVWPSRVDYATPLMQIEEAVAEAVSGNLFPIVIGGEHALSLGPVRALLARYPDLAVLQIDAHGDLRATYDDTPYSHACAMRRLVDLGVPMVQVGIRNISEDEMSWWRAEKPTTIFWARDYCRGTHTPADVIAALGDRPVYLTIDLDGLDPAIMPGVGTPEPGGLGWYETLDLLKALFAARKVVGCDLVELAPIPGQNTSEFTAAKLLYKIIGYKFDGERTRRGT